MIRLLLLFILNIVALSSARANEATVEKLLKQEGRPSVEQIEALLETGFLPDFVSKNQLPVDDDRPSAGLLQNNYPVWFQHLQTNAADFIFELERAYPGAIIVFIGRDTDTIADMTEAFYRHIGQKDRVARIAMSRATLENLTHQDAIAYLAQSGVRLTPGRPLRKIVFVDSISRGGGRQGRFLLNALSQHYLASGGQARDLVRALGFVGLLGHTAHIRKQPIQNHDAVFSYLERTYGQVDASYEFGDLFPVLTFQDSREHPYQGFNESGYEHWVGAWHGPYGRLRNIGGKLIALPEQVHDELRKRAVLYFQLHVVKFGRSSTLLSSVQKLAKAHDFPFEGLQPVSAAREELTRHLAEFQSYEQISTFLRKVQTSNPAHVLEDQEIVHFLIQNLDRLQLPINRNAWTLFSPYTKYPQILNRVGQLLWVHKNKLDTEVLDLFLAAGGKLSPEEAKNLSLEILFNGHYSSALNLLKIHSISITAAEIKNLLQRSRSFSTTFKRFEELSMALGESVVLTPENYGVVLSEAKTEIEHEALFNLVLSRASSSEILKLVLTNNSPIPQNRRIREAFQRKNISDDLDLLLHLFQNKAVDAKEMLEFLNSMLTKIATLDAATIEKLKNRQVRGLFVSHKDSILTDKTLYPALRNHYWSLFDSADENGRAFQLFKEKVPSGAGLFTTFKQIREQLRTWRASPAEIRYFDNLAADKLLKDPAARQALRDSDWIYLLSSTEIGQSPLLERFAPFWTSASEFIIHMRRLPSPSLTNELFDIFLNFNPTLNELAALAGVVRDGWQNSYFEWFAEQYVQNHNDERETLRLLTTLKNLKHPKLVIQKVALAPKVLSSLQTIESVNEWLGYFWDDIEQFEVAYLQALQWVKTPAEFNDLLNPEMAFRTNNLQAYVWKWRAEKKAAGWKFRWILSWSPFGKAVDNGAVRPPCETLLETKAAG